MNKIFLENKVSLGDISKELSNSFDFSFDGTTNFSITYPKLPKTGIGLIVGPSGSGKTTILNSLGDIDSPNWKKGVSVCDHFKSTDDARDRLGASGLNSIPAWMRDYYALSNGEKFRADIAISISDGALVDEFTSVVDRSVAKSCSYALQRYLRASNISMTFSSCHYDVIDWLMPDWVYDLKTGILSSRGSDRRQEIQIELLPCTLGAWGLFSKHHYLSGDINHSSRCWIATWEGEAVGFVSVIAFPSGTIKRAFRGHRTVVLPDYQGLGIGVRISDAAGEIIRREGGRYFSKTSSSRMGRYRNQSKTWRATSKNEKARPDYKSSKKTKESKYKHLHIDRVCYSHEYMGINC